MLEAVEPILTMQPQPVGIAGGGLGGAIAPSGYIQHRRPGFVPPGHQPWAQTPAAFTRTPTGPKAPTTPQKSSTDGPIADRKREQRAPVASISDLAPISATPGRVE
jgi:hypothetical protein